MNPNVRNNRTYSNDLEASTNNTIDSNVSNNHIPSKLMQILQKQRSIPFYWHNTNVFILTFQNYFDNKNDIVLIGIV